MRFPWALACVFAFAPTAVSAAEWRDVFAALPDTAVFLMEDGVLVRAPFHLATRETLWVPTAGQHVVRLRVSPAGTRVAWLARSSDADTTRLWLHQPSGTRIRAKYFAVLSEHLRIAHSEPDVPSIEDRTARGGRFLQPAAQSRRQSLSTLEWLADGSTLVCGYDGGMVAMGAERGRPFRAAHVFPRELESLGPSGVLCVDGFVPEALIGSASGGPGVPAESHELPRVDAAGPIDQFDLDHVFDWHATRDRVVRKRFLVRPGRNHWRLMPLPVADKRLVWSAARGTLWWAEGATLFTSSEEHPEPRTVLVTEGRVLWLGHDAVHDAIQWVTPHGWFRKGALAGSASERLFEPRTRISSVLASRTSGSVMLVTRDSLHVLHPGQRGVRGFRRPARDPMAYFEGPEGQVVVGLRPGIGGGPGLVRLDAGAATTGARGAPLVRDGVFGPVGNGAWILLQNPGKHPALEVHAYDVRANRWTWVRNPGISAWEPVPRASLAGASPGEPPGGVR